MSETMKNFSGLSYETFLDKLSFYSATQSNTEWHYDEENKTAYICYC